MSIITLTTDLGLNDHYLGAVKGSIYSLHPEATIVDISHNVESFNTIEAAFILKNCFYRFPKGSIHILSVNPDLNKDSDFLAIQYKKHYFIGTNNGTFSLIFDQKPEKIFQLDMKRDDNHESFPLGDILVKAACHLAKGGTLEFIGKPIDHMQEKLGHLPITQGDQIRGYVIHIDKYGNALTNISEDFFNSFGRGRKYSIDINGYEINKISKYYRDEPDGEKLAMFSSSKLLEIAMNNGSAAELLGLRYRSGIIINFHDS